MSAPAGAAGPARVAVVGGGITGLAAALRLRDRLGSSARITVWEKDSAPGGKLRTGNVAGQRLELGAEAFLVREPGGDGDSAAVALAHRLGLALVHPEPVPPALLLDGALQPVPAGTLLGVPGDPAAVAPVAQVEPDRDRDEGHPVLPPGEDVAVGDLVRRRLGDPVVDRLVDPMLGGVYAGRADTLSLRATAPGLATACATAHTLTGAVGAAVTAARRPAGGPMFATVADGMSALAEAVRTASAATLRTGLPVRELARTGSGWQLVAGSTRDADIVEVDAVVLALPSRPAARLLRTAGEPAAEPVGVLDYASTALVGLAYPESVVLPERSGFLVPATEGTTIKAATLFTRKWRHLRERGGPVPVRASVGRYGDEHVLRYTDRELLRRAHQEVSDALGIRLPDPVDGHVQRWGGALPQYAPGHVERVAHARASLPPTLRLAGAGYDGVGIPACVRSGQTAADEVVPALSADRL